MVYPLEAVLKHDSKQREKEKNACQHKRHVEERLLNTAPRAVDVCAAKDTAQPAARLTLDQDDAY